MKPFEMDAKMQDVLGYLKKGLTPSEIKLECKEKWQTISISHIVDAKINQIIKRGLWKP